MRCTDGTEIISSTMTRFGNANEFNRSCNGQLVADRREQPARRATGGVPAHPRPLLHRPGRPRRRRRRPARIWALYEVWRSANAAHQGRRHLAGVLRPVVRHPQPGPRPRRRREQLDPRPGRRARPDRPRRRRHRPRVPVRRGHRARARDRHAADQARSGLAVRRRPARLLPARHHGRPTPAAPTTWFTDPWGGGGVTTAAPGWSASTSAAPTNTAWPDLERRSFNLERDYGDANGVHAPN